MAKITAQASELNLITTRPDWYGIGAKIRDYSEIIANLREQRNRQSNPAIITFMDRTLHELQSQLDEFIKQYNK